MGNFLNNSLVQLFQGITYFLQVLRHALIFGFILLLYMPNNELKVTIDFEFKGGKCECKVYSDRMASYSASLLNVRNLSRMTCSNCSPIGDRRKRPTSDPEDWEASSTYKVHHPSLPDSMPRAGCWGTLAMKSTITCPFMDNLDWYSIPYSLNSMAHFSILSDRSGLCKIF